LGASNQLAAVVVGVAAVVMVLLSAALGAARRKADAEKSLVGRADAAAR
jgi:hypothetical protein